MKIDKTLEVKSAEIFEAVINSKYKYSYEDIDLQIQKNSLSTDIQELYKLTTKLRTKRLKNGYDFRTSEYRLQLDENLHLKEVKEEKSSPSHKLVEECMLLANIQAAKTLDGIGIYRVHEEPKRSKIDELLKNVALLGLDVKLKKDIHSTIASLQSKALNVGLEYEIDKLIIQSQQQASYKSLQAGHFGLGFTHYSHFTSPIRRYSDLVLHRILKTKTIPKDIDTICENISTQERNITSCVWDYEDRKYARWAKDNLYKEFMVKLVDIDKSIVQLLDGAIGLKATVTNYKGQKLFAKFRVKLVSSDIFTKKIVADIKY
jgi:ribonuclease R